MWPSLFVGGQSLRRALQVKPGVSQAFMERRVVMRLFVKAHFFAILMACVAIVPGLNFLYSGHGGLAWMFLPLAFPIALIQYAREYVATRKPDRPAKARLIGQTFLVYAVASLLASATAVFSIQQTFGLPIPVLEFWSMFFFPFNLPFVLGK